MSISGYDRFCVGVASCTQADAPDPSLVPQGDILGVTVVLLTCSYQNREFVRVGYYLNNEYLDPEMRENPPATVNVEEVGV